jgi:glycosyltransferase involved in cell wall biosynthesis
MNPRILQEQEKPNAHASHSRQAAMVSIGMPVYNGAAFIRKALDSILAQTYPYFELIISDNASTDDTERICREYMMRDSRIKYLRQDSNIGASANFRAVLDLARHERFIWAAADDWWDADRLERLVDAFQPEDAAVIGSIRRYVSDILYAEYTPVPFPKGTWWKFLMREEARCEKVYYIYGLMWKSVATKAFYCEDYSGYCGDAIFCYFLLWQGNLKSIPGATLHVTSHRTSEGDKMASTFRYSLSRLLWRAHPWDYYARFIRLTPLPWKSWMLVACVIKAGVSQIHLWWRAFRRLVLGRPYVHGALPGGEKIVRDAEL